MVASRRLKGMWWGLLGYRRKELSKNTLNFMGSQEERRNRRKTHREIAPVFWPKIDDLQKSAIRG
jgi:hypothetical protein